MEEKLDNCTRTAEFNLNFITQKFSELNFSMHIFAPRLSKKDVKVKILKHLKNPHLASLVFAFEAIKNTFPFYFWYLTPHKIYSFTLAPSHRSFLSFSSSLFTARILFTFLFLSHIVIIKWYWVLRGDSVGGLPMQKRRSNMAIEVSYKLCVC